jgi:hypothetical protein
VVAVVVAAAVKRQRRSLLVAALRCPIMPAVTDTAHLAPEFRFLADLFCVTIMPPPAAGC